MALGSAGTKRHSRAQRAATSPRVGASCGATRLLAKLRLGPGGNGTSMLPGLGVGSPVAGDDDGPATSS
ncbi:MAG: hypothetical protein JRI23_33195 [Deltaproteobacteria bacterium]|nr:hypothetical protein [Deltaproteobacteria bacterium]